MPVFAESAFSTTAFSEAGGPGANAESLVETIILTPVMIGSGQYTIPLADSTVITDSGIFTYLDSLSDSVLVVDSLLGDLGHLFTETLSLIDTPDPIQQVFPELIDRLDVDDLLIRIFPVIQTDGLVHADTVAGLRSWAYNQAEILDLADTPTTVAAINIVVAVLLSIQDGLGQGGVVSETVSLAEQMAEQASFTANILNALVLSDSAGTLFVFSGSISDSVSHTDEITRLATIQGLLADELSFVLIDSHNQAVYVGHAMNTKNQGVTTFSNYNFNSVAKVGGQYIGASDTGLYTLEGDDDAGTPIAARARTGRVELTQGLMARVEQAYIGVRSSGRMVLKVITDDDNERWYEARLSNHGVDTQRFKTGRGVKSRYWQFELVNQAGDDFELEKLEVYPVALTRRI